MSMDKLKRIIYLASSPDNRAFRRQVVRSISPEADIQIVQTDSLDNLAREWHDFLLNQSRRGVGAASLAGVIIDRDIDLNGNGYPFQGSVVANIQRGTREKNLNAEVVSGLNPREAVQALGLPLQKYTPL